MEPSFTEQFLHDLTLNYDTWKPAKESEVKVMKERYANIFDIGMLEEVYSYSTALSVLYNHYVWPPGAEDSFLSRQNLQRLMFDIGVVGKLMKKDAFLWWLNNMFPDWEYFDFTSFMEFILSLSSIDNTADTGLGDVFGDSGWIKPSATDTERGLEAEMSEFVKTDKDLDLNEIDIEDLMHKLKIPKNNKGTIRGWDMRAGMWGHGKSGASSPGGSPPKSAEKKQIE